MSLKVWRGSLTWNNQCTMSANPDPRISTQPHQHQRRKKKKQKKKLAHLKHSAQKTQRNVCAVLYVNLALFGLQAGGGMITSHLSVLQCREGVCETEKKKKTSFALSGWILHPFTLHLAPRTPSAENSYFRGQIVCLASHRRRIPPRCMSSGGG